MNSNWTETLWTMKSFLCANGRQCTRPFEGIYRSHHKLKLCQSLDPCAFQIVLPLFVVIVCLLCHDNWVKERMKKKYRKNAEANRINKLFVCLQAQHGLNDIVKRFVSDSARTRDSSNAWDTFMRPRKRNSSVSARILCRAKTEIFGRNLEAAQC